MSSNAVRAIVEAKLSSIIGVTCKIAWDNVPYNPKVGVTFVRCSIDGVFSQQIAIGCVRDTYRIVIDVLTPYGVGTKDNMTLSDSIIAGFVNYASGYLSCKTGVIERVGQVEEWHQRTVVIDAQYDNHF